MLGLQAPPAAGAASSVALTAPVMAISISQRQLYPDSQVNLTRWLSSNHSGRPYFERADMDWFCHVLF